MAKSYTVLVVGDSAIANCGVYENSYLDFFINEWSYEQQVDVVTSATFNVTSVDALAHFHDYLKIGVPDVLVVGLGNCDAAGFGFYKHKAIMNSPLLARTADAWQKGKHPLSRRNPPYYYRAKPVHGQEVPPVVSPKAYGKNIRTLLDATRSKGVQTVLVNLGANQLFPPCNNVGNAIFYKLFGVRTNFPYAGSGEHPELVRALRLHDAGDTDGAANEYRSLLSCIDERGVIAVNNLASIHYDAQDYDGAADLLGKVNAESVATGPLFHYNLGILAMARGEESEAEQLFAYAYEKDTGSYRIRPSYRKQIERLCKGRGFLRTVDWGGQLSDRDFIDYCHPNIQGQKMLAGELARELEEVLLLEAGDKSPTVRYLPWNPDRSMGNRTDFYKYMGITTMPHAGFIGEILAESEAPYQAALSGLDKSCSHTDLNARNTILAHPLYGHSGFLAHIHPKEKTDQGKLPELFFLRISSVLYNEYGKRSGLREFMKPVERLIPSTVKTDNLLGVLTLPKGAIPDVEVLKEIHSTLPLGEIFQRACEYLAYVLSKEPAGGSKLKSITYWFMREALVFGTPSDPLMLCRRLDYLKLVDTCLFYAAFCEKGDSHKANFASLVDMLGELLDKMSVTLSSLAYPREALDLRSEETVVCRIRQKLETILSGNRAA